MQCPTPKTCVPKELKGMNVKAFNMITNKDEDKAMTEYISCDCKCKFSSKAFNLKRNGIIKHFNANVKTIIWVKKIIVRILAHIFVRIVSI